MIPFHPQIILTQILNKRLINLPSNTQKITYTASFKFQEPQWIGELFSDKQLASFDFLKIYDCQKIQGGEKCLQEKDFQSAQRCFSKMINGEKPSLKLSSFGDYGNQFFRNVSSNSLYLLTTGNRIYKEKQSEALLIRKKQASKEKGKRRAQKRNENLKALERIAYRKGKIGKKETMRIIS